MITSMASTVAVRNRLGVQIAYAWKADFAVLLPSVHVQWVHEFMEDHDSPTVRYAADPTDLSVFKLATNDMDTNYAAIGADVTATMPNGWVAFIAYSTVLGLHNLSYHGVSAGFRKAF